MWHLYFRCKLQTNVSTGYVLGNSRTSNGAPNSRNLFHFPFEMLQFYVTDSEWKWTSRSLSWKNALQLSTFKGRDVLLEKENQWVSFHLRSNTNDDTCHLISNVEFILYETFLCRKKAKITFHSFDHIFCRSKQKFSFRSFDSIIDLKFILYFMSTFSFLVHWKQSEASSKYDFVHCTRIIMVVGLKKSPFGVIKRFWCLSYIINRLSCCPLNALHIGVWHATIRVNVGMIVQLMKFKYSDETIKWKRLP